MTNVLTIDIDDIDTAFEQALHVRMPDAGDGQVHALAVQLIESARQTAHVEYVAHHGTEPDVEDSLNIRARMIDILGQHLQ